MNHLTLRGTHREMGFQWGARLAERGLRLLDHVPFPLEAERRGKRAPTPGGKQPAKPLRKIAMFGLNFRRRRAGLHNKKFVSQRHSPLPFDAFYSPFTMEKGGCFDK